MVLLSQLRVQRRSLSAKIYNTVKLQYNAEVSKGGEVKHTRAILLMNRVEKDMKPLMMNPARIHLISDIPDPAA